MADAVPVPSSHREVTDLTLRWTELQPAHIAPARDRLGREAARSGLGPEQCELAELMVSELLTNALRHARGHRVGLTMWRSDLRCFVVEVHDGLANIPVLPAPESAIDTDAENGRGLFMVTQLSGGLCGVACPPSSGHLGKTVWFALVLPHTPAGAVSLRVLSAQVGIRQARRARVNPPLATLAVPGAIASACERPRSGARTRSSVLAAARALAGLGSAHPAVH